MPQLTKLQALADRVSLEDIVLLCRICQLRAEAKTRRSKLTTEQLADNLGMKSSALYKRISRLVEKCQDVPELAAALDVRSCLQGSIDSSFMNPAFNMLDAFHRLIKGQVVPEGPGSVTASLGAHVSVSTRILAPALRKLSADSPVQIELHSGEPWELLERDDLDLVLAIDPGPQELEDEEVASIPVRPCLICDINHPFSIDTSAFDWEKLRDQTLVLFQDDRTHTGFSRKKLPKPKRIMYVRTLLEAHAAALSGSGIAFTYREILGEEDEKYLHVIDLVGLPGVSESSRLVLRRPQAAKKGRESENEKEIIDGLENLIKSHLGSLRTDTAEAERLSKSLAAYRFAYHTTMLGVGTKSPRPAWIAGTIKLSVTSTGFVKAWHTVLTDHGEVTNQIFGRVIQSPDPAEPTKAQYHLLWREKDRPRERTEQGKEKLSLPGGLMFSEQDAVSFVFSDNEHLHLKRKRPKPLVGSWIGRPTLEKASEFRPGGGTFILHTEKLDLKKVGHRSELDRLVEEYASNHPAIRVLQPVGT